MMKMHSEGSIVDIFRLKLNCMSTNPEKSYFSTFSTSIKNKNVLNYSSFALRSIQNRARTSKTILYVSSNSIESIITTFSLLLSRYNVYILPADFKYGSKLCDEVLKTVDDYIFVSHEKIDFALCV